MIKSIKILGFILFVCFQLSYSFLFFESLLLSEIIFSLAVSILFVSIITLINQLNISNRIRTVLTYLLLIVFITFPVIFIGYFIQFKSLITKDELFAVFQTNIQEMIEFMSVYYTINYLLMLLLFLVLLGFIVSKFKKKQLPKKQTIFTGIVLFISAIVFYFSFSEVRTFQILIDSYEEYSEELSKFKETQNRINNVAFSAQKEGNGELYIVVVGESLNKNHMSLYGYHRETTPSLDSMNQNKSIDVFTNAYSSQTHTVPVLTQALTQSTTTNEINYYESPTVINVFNNAGFETYWLSNQIKYGGWDNPVTAISEASDFRFRFNKKIGKQTETTDYDEVVLSRLEKIINTKSEKNRVVFVHLMGNHFNYAKRYPPTFIKYGYKEELKDTEFGSTKKLAWMVNAYDNSVIYNDYVVSNIIKEVERYNDGPSAVVYFSDHSEDVLTNARHHSKDFNFSMIQIPLITYFSKKYKEDYAKRYEIIKNNSDRLFCNDYIYDLMIGLSDIKTEEYNSKNDLSSSDYNHKESEAHILDSFKVTDDLNYYLHRKNNSNLILENKQQNRILPHRVNSIGKAVEIKNLGLSSIELDIRLIKDSLGSLYFNVGHDEISDTTDLLNADYILERMNINSNSKIWLDIKNLNQENVEGCYKLLKNLSMKSSAIFIVESSITDGSLKYLSERDIYTSYYLSNQLRDIREDNVLAKKAVEIIDFIKNSEIKSISFDVRLYPFVLNFIEPSIRTNIHYHTWDLSLDFASKGSVEKLLKKEYYLNDRVKTILMPFHSNFNY